MWTRLSFARTAAVQVGAVVVLAAAGLVGFAGPGASGESVAAGDLYARTYQRRPLARGVSRSVPTRR
jgi:hypothetical protein